MKNAGKIFIYWMNQVLSIKVLNGSIFLRQSILPHLKYLQEKNTNDRTYTFIERITNLSITFTS